jgi:hypothetical protein
MTRKFSRKITSVLLSVSTLVTIVATHNSAYSQSKQPPSSTVAPAVLVQRQTQPDVMAVESVGMTVSDPCSLPTPEQEKAWQSAIASRQTVKMRTEETVR